MIFVICSVVENLLVLGAILIYLLYWWGAKNLNYWKNLNVPYLKSEWLFGSAKNEILKRAYWFDFVMKCYTTFKDNGFGGILYFRTPILIVCDAKLIEKMLVEDFVHFEDRMCFNRRETLLNSLLYATGEKWRIMRSKIVTQFTSKKIKGMFKQISVCSDSILTKIDKLSEKGKSFEIEPLIFEFSTETIASCTIGVQLLSDSIESKKFKSAIDLLISTSPIKVIKGFFSITFPKLASMLGMQLIDKSVEDYFRNLTKGIMSYRQENQIKRDDFLQLILSLKDEEESSRETMKVDDTEEKILMKQSDVFSDGPKVTEKIFTEDCIASMMINFIMAGLKPTVVAISFALLEIAKSSVVQEKVHKEIDSVIVKCNGWNVEAVKCMTYLDQIIQESLRLYNCNHFLARTVSKPYKLPGTHVTLEKDLKVFFPVTAIHLDPQYYNLPEAFDPERFAGNNYKPSSSFMPFGYGPRICISIKFAIMIIKVCLARILFRYKISLDQRMQIPIIVDKNEIFPKVVGGIRLRFEKREIFKNES